MSSLSTSTVLKKLKKLYNPPKTFLNYRTHLDLLVATILSAQCTDARVNLVTRTLFRKYRTANDYIQAPQSELEGDIHSCGTFRTKAKHIQGLCRLLLEKHRGKVPGTMEDLVALPGVGRKTASIILAVLFGKHEGIAVDTHVLRVSRRLGLSRHPDPKRVELDLMEQLPRSEWGTINTLLISHGRALCTARDRHCEACVFRHDCPSSRVRGCGDLAAKKRSTVHYMRRPISIALLSLFLLGGCAFSWSGNGSSLSSSDSQGSSSSRTLRNGVIWKDGKLLLLDGKTALRADLTLGNSVIVGIDGSVRYTDGSTVTLQDGQAVDLKGNVYASAAVLLQ